MKANVQGNITENHRGNLSWWRRK